MENKFKFECSVRVEMFDNEGHFINLKLPTTLFYANGDVKTVEGWNQKNKGV